MPQLEFADYAPQLIWLVITFGILYLVMARVALPRIGGVIEERRNRIAEDFDSADRLRIEADEALKAYEAALATARAQALEIAGATRDRLNAEVDAERTKLEAELEVKLNAAEASIQETKDAATAQVGTIAADVAAELVTILNGSAPDKAKIDNAVAAALAANKA
ncbi:MAG: ATP F0F1 synthase subunit B [Alphaproteobacteria bacterium]